MPPSPNMSTGPNCGSLLMPTITSVPDRAIAWTATPSMRAFGWRSLTAATISS